MSDVNEVVTPYQVEPIGVIRSCFTGKFGIPRQPGLVPAAKATLTLLPPYNRPETVLGLHRDGVPQVSHLWLQFLFHDNLTSSWQATVRPPRLGGNKRMGVFATRSPLRPNSLGLSVVRLEKIELKRGVSLHVSGVDLLDGTPVLDIKPYAPYVDSISDAFNVLADKAPRTINVCFNDQTRQFCDVYSSRTGEDLRQLISEILQQDPRPRYQRPDPDRRYGMRLYDLDVRWHYEQDSLSGQAGNGWLIKVVEIVYWHD